MQPRTDQDVTLVRRLAEADETAFAELYDRYAGAMLRAAGAILGRDHDAQDAVQEVFLALARRRKALAGVRNLRAYLFTALRRQCGRCVARRDRAALALSVVAEQAPGRQVGGDGEFGDRLARAMAALPRAQREVLMFKIDGDLTFAELADVMGISPNTAASRYRYALEKLRASMEA